jgi:putative nucleotidyltransferase with HDIG domain
MKKFTVNDLVPGTFFTAPVYLFKNYILAAPTVPMTDALIGRLKKWDYPYVYSDGNPLFKQSGGKRPEERNLKIDEKIKSYFADLEGEQLQKIEAAINFYYSFLDFTSGVINFYIKHDSIDLEEIHEYVQQALRLVQDSCHAILLFSEYDYPLENYLIKHSANVTLLSLAIGKLLRLKPEQLIALGTAALLHDIGMTKIPQKIYLGKGQLTYHEREIIQSHCIFGYNVLKGINAPETIARAALEHHERLDGSGYPKNLKEPKISPLAKIIAVACSFEAATSERPYKEAIDGHKALIDIINYNRQKYDINVLKALVRAISFFPLGTIVLLSNRMTGVVVKVNPNFPDMPLVKILFDAEHQPVIQHKVLQTSAQEGIKVIKSLTKRELAALQ